MNLIPIYISQIDSLPPPERADYARYVAFVLSGDEYPDFNPLQYLETWH
jgi:hypothetical protein